MARLLLFGGKGGVGKTTTACATALWLADSGFKTLLVSSDPAHSTSDSLDYPLGPEPTPVIGVNNLFGLELDPEGKLQSMMPRMGDALSGGGGIASMLGSDVKEEIESIKDETTTAEMLFPGLDEAFAFDELLKHLEDPSWDVIVFDTAPTGHTLRFLALPEIIEAWADRLIRLHRVTGGIRSMLFGRKDGEAMRTEMERFRKRVIHVRRILSDANLTRFTLVTIPESMGVSETVRARVALAEFGIPVGGIVVNRVTPDIDHEFLSGRRDVEFSRISQLTSELELPITIVELLNTDVQGVELLRDIGAHLFGNPSDPGVGLGPFEIGTELSLMVHRGMWYSDSNGERTIQLHMPGISRDDLSLRSENGVLLVGINGREHEIDCGRPVKASEIGAKLDKEILNLIVPSIE